MALKILFSMLLFIIGSCFASFFGVVCSRVPNDLSVIKPSSRCDKCGHKLLWYENVPIISYLALGGKCSSCKEKIGFSGFLFELLGGGSLVICYLSVGFNYLLLFYIPLILILLLISMYDYYTNTILDLFWIILLVIGVGLSIYKILVLDVKFYQLLIGAGACALLFGLLKLIFYLILKKDCLGNGDIIVMSIAGLFLGVRTIIVALLVASVIGLLIELIIFLTSKDKTKERLLPFCPYLSIGIYVALIYGDKIMNLILGVI